MENLYKPDNCNEPETTEPAEEGEPGGDHRGYLMEPEGQPLTPEGNPP